jgi:hypothetical protein
MSAGVDITKQKPSCIIKNRITVSINRCAFKSNFAIYIRKNTPFWSAKIKRSHYVCTDLQSGKTQWWLCHCCQNIIKPLCHCCQNINKPLALWHSCYQNISKPPNLVPRASVWGRGETRGSPGLGRSRDDKIWQYLTATRQGVARYSLMKYTSLRNK